MLDPVLVFFQNNLDVAQGEQDARVRERLDGQSFKFFVDVFRAGGQNPGGRKVLVNRLVDAPGFGQGAAAGEMGRHVAFVDLEDLVQILDNLAGIILLPIQGKH